MAEEYKASPNKFGLRGLQLSRPVDVLEPNKYAILKNVRSYTDGEIQSRPGMILLYALAATPTHSIKRLNDDVNARSAYFTGAGTKLYADDSGHTSATEIDSGYSGDPISMVPHRPDQSPLPWLYVMDRTRGGRKAKSTAAGDTFKSYPQGIAPPTTAPVVSLNAPTVKVVSEFDTAVGWAQGGTAGAPALLVGKRVDTTIAQILYDSGSTGWASISPSVLSAQLQPGMRLVIDSAGTPETVTVEDVYPAITSTTISSIVYDNAPTNTGLCTVVLVAPSAELRINSMLRIATAENVRVLSVTIGPQGITSFRCSTASTRAATNAVDGLASFRVNCTANHAAAQTLTDEAVESTVTAGTGTLTFTGALDLSIIGTRPVTDQDYMVANVRVDKPQLVTEIKIRVDVADTTNDFTKDFYEKSFRAADLTAAIQGSTPTLTVQQQILQRDQIDTGGGPSQLPLALQRKLALDNPDYQYIPIGPILPGPPTGDATDTQLGLGSGVWSTLTWQLNEAAGFNRIGTDSSRNLRNVAAIQISIITTGTVVLDLDSWYVRGGYGLDVQGAYWAYRYRSLETKARSNLSPPTRSPLDVTRGAASVVCATKDTTASGDPQVTVIDVYRFDGVLEDYTYVGSVANPTNAATTTATFTDEFSDEIVQLQGELAEHNQFQPFPLSDLPRSGVVNVKGTEVAWVSGDIFNTAWGRGSKPLKINGTLCTLYTNPSSSTVLSLNENLGTLANATFEFPEPLLLGQPRPVMWGPYGGGELGIFFFSLYLGTLLWTNANNPDAASDANQLEITNPSEPLMNGYIFDGRPYVCSTEKTYEIAFIGSGFVAKEIADTKGLYARWGLTVMEGGKVYKVARDGIYESEGAQDVCITDDLQPLFPHNGIAGISVNGYLPPDFTLPNKMRLSSGDGMVRFKYQDTGGTQRCMVFDVERRSWDSEDTYTPQANVFYSGEGQSVHEELIGSTDGKLYRAGGTADGSTAIASAVRTPALDMGSPRQYKQFGDAVVDLNSNSVAITASVYTNNFSALISSVVLSNASRSLAPSIDLNAGEGVLAYNVGMDFSWATYGPKLYQWIPSFIPRTDLAIKRATDWYVFAGTKYVRGLVIEADTMGVARTVKIQADGIDIGIALTINHNGQISKPYGFIPFTAHSVRLLPTDSNPWQFFEITKWEADDYPELQTIYTSIDDNGYFGDKYVRGVLLEVDTAGDIITLSVKADGVIQSETIIVTASGRSEKYHAFTAPFIAREIQLIPDKPIRLGPPWKVRWDFDQYPELSALITAWDDAGYEGAKFVQGMVLEADTGNSPCVLQVQGDQGIVQATVTATHNGRSEIAYPRPGDTWVPFIAHMLRIIPGGGARLNPPFKVRYIFEPEPELAITWQTQPTTFDLPNFHFLRDGYIAHRSTADITLTITIDNGSGVATDYTYVIAHNNGNYKKSYVTFQAVKGKYTQMKLTSTAGFRLYQKDCLLRVGSWARHSRTFGQAHPGAYLEAQPFGDVSRTSGARI